MYIVRFHRILYKKILASRRNIAHAFLHHQENKQTFLFDESFFCLNDIASRTEDAMQKKRRRTILSRSPQETLPQLIASISNRVGIPDSSRLKFGKNNGETLI